MSEAGDPLNRGPTGTVEGHILRRDCRGRSPDVRRYDHDSPDPFVAIMAASAVAIAAVVRFGSVAVPAVVLELVFGILIGPLHRQRHEARREGTVRPPRRRGQDRPVLLPVSRGPRDTGSGPLPKRPRPKRTTRACSAEFGPAPARRGDHGPGHEQRPHAPIDRRGLGWTGGGQRRMPAASASQLPAATRSWSAWSSPAA